MAGNFSTTTRFSLRRLLGTSKGSDIDEGFQRLAEDVDTKMVGYEQDTLAKRPAAGRPNAEFRATDTGIRYRDNGTTWEQITTSISIAVPEARVTRAASTAFTPSATRPTLVLLAAQMSISNGASGGSVTVEVLVGGASINFLYFKLQASEGESRPAISFVVPPGKTWEYKVFTSGVVSSVVQTNYQFL